MTRSELLAVIVDALAGGMGWRKGDEIPEDVLVSFREDAELVLSAVEHSDATLTYSGPRFKRHGDPHGCPEREHSCALGTRLHCRLEPHGEDTPHAMEVSGPYVLEHDDTVASRHVPAQEQRA